MRHFMTLALVTTLATSTLVNTAQAWQVNSFSVRQFMQSARPGATAGAGSVAAAGAQAQPANTSGATGDPKQQRLEKINQLQFDRRPSVILKAWLEFEKEQKAAAEKNSSPAQPPAPEAKAAEAPPAAKAEEPAPAEAATPEPASTEPASTEPLKEEPPAADAEKPADSAKPADAAADVEKAKAEEAQKKAAQKKADEEKAKAEQARIAAEQAKALKEFEKQLKTFVRDVTLSRWTEVKTFLASLEKEEAKAAYSRLLEGLRSGPAGSQGNQVDPQVVQQMLMNAADQAAIQEILATGGQGPGAQFLEKNRFSMADIAGLTSAAPHPLDNESFTKLGTLLRQTLVDGRMLDELLIALHVDKDNPDPKLTKREVARLLSAAGQESRAGDYLPTLEEARSGGDAQGLNLLARHYLAKHGEKKKETWLEEAWAATQAVLALPVPPDEKPEPEPTPTPVVTEGESQTTPAETKDPEQKDPAKKEVEKTPEQKAAEEAKKQREELRGEIKAALTRAVELAPRLPDEVGKAWLDESFRTRLERGREILVALGTQVSTNLQSRPRDADFRLKSLELERTAVESLLRAAPETALQWRDSVTLLAANWLKEAEVTKQFDNRNQFGQDWGRDRYGNFYYIDDENAAAPHRFQNSEQPEAIKTSDLLDARPRDEWLKLVDADLKPKFAMTASELYLKAGEDSEAFPYIEQLAVTHPQKAHQLAQEFLRVWTRNHDPNDGREGYNPYMYYWGYEQRADRIPLTRSKQERSLKELGGWVTRMRALPIEELDEKLLANAFTTSHSSAEVYRLESLEDVFGSIDNLKPRTLAELIQKMRGNLAGVWRLPDLQKKNSTNRKQRDIQLEVKRGYELARTVVRQALEKHPDHWALVMAEAAVLHDENDYQQEVEKSSEFSERRLEALARFRRAADLYAVAVGDLAEEDQSPQVYEQWFYASLGSVDLERVTAEKVPNDKQPALIREAMNALSGETAERHRSQFANNMFTRARSAKPELKYRYLKSGFEIVGDHKMAREARKLLDYYGDLVSEIKLEAKVDGSDIVGYEQPFGVFVNILHTKEIERESGGFGRYLQNQNNNQSYFYNFGRPLQNYRDKFRDTVTQAIGEQFEVVSITFQEPEVTSKAGETYGWRVTPYAYLLIKAKGREVDKLAPLRLDLDFLDTSGYAMLPVETPALPIDAKSATPPARPASELALTQTLDERQSAEGKLILEIRVKGRGLMPKLEELIDVKTPGFKQTGVEGGDLSVTQFDKEASETVVNSERVWLVTLEAADKETPPQEFHFASAKLPLKETVYQRYEDADLVAVKQNVSLTARYDRTSYAWLWLPIVGLTVLAVGGIAAVRTARGRKPEEPARFHMPTEVTPFTVLGLLRDIQQNNGLKPAERQELVGSIDRLERHFFQAPEQPEPNLQEIAAGWLSKTGLN